MTSNWASEDNTPPAPATGAGAPRTAAWLTWVILAAILVLGASLSTLNLFGWDSDTGQHPDERFMTDVADHLKMPLSLGEYIDSARSPLNPRNTGHTFYVYGMLPETLTHITAVLLTPDSALAPTVSPADAVNYGKLPQVPNPDLRVPKLTLLQPLLNPGGNDLTSYYFVYRVGRAWSALFELLGVLVVFLIGRRLYGRRVGLLAALLLALSALPIQIAHFFTVDSATAFFTLLSVYWAVRLAQDGGWGSATALGLSIGAAMACRVTMATLGLLAILAVAQRIWGAGEGSKAARPLLPRVGVALLVLAGLVTIVSFRLMQPDAFVGTSLLDLRPDPRFIDNISTIGGYVSGELDSPPSQQWAARTPFVFPLQNMVLWGMGLPLGLAAWAAWAVAGVLLARAAWAGVNGAGWTPLRRRLVHLLPWSWVAFYFAWQGGQFGMTMRYYLLLYGLLALFAAWGLVQIVDRRSQIADWAHKKATIYNLQSAMRWVPLIVVVAGTFCWAYAFTRIYTRPHSRIMASRWMYEHVPAGSIITSEQWDDALPLSVDGRRAFKDPGFPEGGGFYFNVQMAPYGEDDQIKYTGYPDKDGKHVPGLFEQLDQSDYIILSSNRVYGSATRLPMRYPALTRYYHYLFSGELGFAQVADITSYPTLFGIPIPDQGAEEAFSVYDHPRVLIFKKTPQFTRARAEQLIASDVAWEEVYKIPTLRGSKVPTALRLTQDQWPSFRAAGSWAALFDPAGLTNQAPWLFWLLALELLGLATFALLFRPLAGLPDRGFALAKMLGLLVVAYGAWLLGSANAMAFTPGSVWLCAGLLIAAGAAAGWRARAEIVAFARRRRAALLTAEGLFLLAFLGFTLIRALNPDLWHPARGGEKPMDLAFLTAVLKSASFPPYDPWFAGGYINYYYFGFVIVGALTHMTGIVPTTAYNLAVPTLFALTALGAWGAAYNLLAPHSDTVTRWHGDKASDPGEGTAPSPPRFVALPSWMKRERRAIATGVVAAAFVVLLSPLTQALWYLPGSATPTFAGLPAECEVSSYAGQQQCRGRAEWAFWDASRLVGMDLQDSTINEFPYFTFLFADLHAHMIALPLALAALGLMVALVRPKTKDQRRKGVRRLLFGLPSLVLLALVVGALRATNTWDYPTYLGLSVLTLALLAWLRLRRGERWPAVVLGWAVSSGVVVLGSILLFLPFTRSFATDYAGFQLWRGERTPAIDFLKIDGLWLFLLASGALLLYYRRGSRPLRLALMGGGALLLAILAVALKASAPALLLPLAGAALGLLIDLLFGRERTAVGVLRAPAPPPADTSPEPLADPYVQLALPLLELDEPEQAAAPADLAPAVAAGRRLVVGPTTLLPLLWALAGLLIALGTEFVVAKGDIGRMNSVFKFGMQSWVLLALAAAPALTALWPAAGRLKTRGYGLAWRGAAGLLIAMALVYPLTATPARLADRIDSRVGPTLDGVAFMRSERAGWGENNQQFSFEQDAAALDWLRANVAGTPIVLEAHTEAYRWGGRVSIYTGLPTLLGWPWHETQQRSVADVGPVLAARQALIQKLYSSADQAEALQTLHLYGVEYVYVGQLERALYDPAGLAKFDAMARAGQIQQVYAGGDTRIYQVPRDPAAPPPAVLTTSLSTRPAALPQPNETRLDTPVFKLPAVGEYAWNRLADSQPVAVLLWLLACYALLALGLPAAVLIFGRQRDGGFAWARLIGLLLLGYAVWMPVSMRLWSYNRWGLLWGALLVLALDAAIVAWLGRRAGSDGRHTTDDEQGASVQTFRLGLRAIRDHLLAHGRAALLVEALFLGAFALMALLRAYNPDLWHPVWGGEKPFEFGLLNAILRSPVMPPYDPFFSDGTINYYYYGLFLASLPIKATGIAPAVGFNLVIATLFAFTLVGAFALVARLAGRLRSGLLGAAFVALLGNLAAAFPIGLSRGLGPVREALAGGLAGFGERLGDWFWGPSRVIYGDKLITINEFPFWSYLFADLHPHLIAMPIALLVIALAFELLDSRPSGLGTRDLGLAKDAQAQASRPKSLAPALSLVALALGALAVTNPWDVPTYGLLLAGALFGRAWLDRAYAGRRLWARLGGALALVGGVGLAALLLYLPFFQGYVRPVGVSGIGLVRDGSPLGAYLLIYGLFLAVLAPWMLALALRLRPGFRRRVPSAAAPLEEPAESTAVLGIVARPPSATARRATRLALASVVPLLAILLAFPQLSSVVWLSTLALKVVLAALLVVGAAVLLARRLPRAAWFAAWMATVAWAVSLGVELVYIRDHLDGGDAYRMNTVFKFGLQSWILMALAAAVALPWLLRGLRRLGAVAQGLGWAILATLVALALVFPLAGVPSRLAYRFEGAPAPTLDGLAFLDTAEFDIAPSNMGLSGDAPVHIKLRADGEAIRWLNQNIAGSPIVLQSDLWFYVTYGTRVAANTGLPTIVSPLHASEQHDPFQVNERDLDVQQIYRTTDQSEALRLLSKYHVGYLYVGAIERAAYGEAGAAKFDRMDGSYLSAVYKNDAVKIYRVNDSVYDFAADTVPANPPFAGQPQEESPGDSEQPAPAAEPTPDTGSLEQLEAQVAADPTAASPAYQLAQRYRDQGRFDDAARVLEPAARAHPKDVAVSQFWGDILRDGGHPAEAEAAYRAATAAEPTAGNYNKLGVELLHWGQLDKAAEALNLAVAADPSVAEPYFHLGEIYEQQGQSDRAAEQYQSYLNIAGPDERYRAAATQALDRLKK